MIGLNSKKIIKLKMIKIIKSKIKMIKIYKLMNRIIKHKRIHKFNNNRILVIKIKNN